MTQLALLLDKQRINTQLWRVRLIMADGQWRALYEICHECRDRFEKWDSEAAISARLRDLRKYGYSVERRIRKGTKNLREYRVR